MSTPIPAPGEPGPGWAEPGPTPPPPGPVNGYQPPGAPAGPGPAPGLGEHGIGAPVPGSTGEWTAPAPEETDPDRPRARVEWLVALGVAVVITLLGFPLGWLWSSVAPWTPVQMTSDGAVLAQPEQEQMVADEGWYLGITVVVGILVAVLAWLLLRRYRGVPMALALAVGSVGGGVVTWRFGRQIGLTHFRHLAEHAAVGTNFGKPVDLRVAHIGLWQGFLPYARGDVLALAIAATIVYLLFVGFSPHPSLRASRHATAEDAPAGEPAGHPVSSGS